MLRSGAASIVFCLLAAGCAGTSPSLGHHPESGLSSIIIGGRFILPSGETRNGQMWINFEGQGDRGNGETYRLKIRPGQPLLYQVEPDTYHLTPTRSVFGKQEERIKVEIDGRTISTAFPRSILRKLAITVKPTKIVPLGVVEVRVKAALPGHEPEMSVWLDDSLDARRQLTESTIHEMMDPDAPTVYRTNAVEWTAALDQSLNDLSTEPAPSKLYKQGSP